MPFAGCRNGATNTTDKGSAIQSLTNLDKDNLQKTAATKKKNANDHQTAKIFVFVPIS